MMGLAITVIALGALTAQAAVDATRTGYFFGLTHVAELRLEAISFFAVVLLICPLAVRGLWNWIRQDFPRLPRITYGKSLAVVVLWGLLFLVVMTMIATARESMMPGSWRKQGLLYSVPKAPAPNDRPMEAQP